MAALLLDRNQARHGQARQMPLAVCGVMPATRASSDAVKARPSISASSMPARAGSPAAWLSPKIPQFWSFLASSHHRV